MPSGPNTMRAIVERLYKSGMYWSELYVALDEQGIVYDPATVRRAVYACGFKLKNFDHAEYVAKYYMPGMSIETLYALCRIDEEKIYQAVRRLGEKRPKTRSRMTDAELETDSMLYLIFIKPQVLS